MQANNQYEDKIHFKTVPCAKINRQPSIHLPFRRNDDFIVREELATLCYQLSSPGARTALVGFEGFGKTYLATEFAYRFHEENPATWMLWVNASSKFRFEECYRTIANALQIPGRDEEDVDFLVLVESWLTKHELDTWLIIVDNANDIRLSSDTPQHGGSKQRWIPRRPLLEYLPSPPHSRGRILITTQNRAIASTFVKDEKGIIDLTPMLEESALQLLEKEFKASNTVYDPNALKSLAQEIHCIPLALVQASAYICRTAPQVTVADYIRQLPIPERPYAQLARKYGQEDAWWRSSSFDSIISTFHCSFMLLRQRYPSACRLLSLMSFFEREGIVENLLIGWYLAEGQDTRYDAAIFDTDIALLQNLRLIDQNQQERLTSFRLHRTVQVATQHWLEFEREKSEWQRCYFELLNAQSPGRHPDQTNWHKCQFLLPHVASMMKMEPMSRSVRPIYVEILVRNARYVFEKREYARAHAMMQRSDEVGGEPKDDIWFYYGIRTEAAAKRKSRLDADEWRERVVTVLTQTFGADSRYEDWIFKTLSQRFFKHLKYEQSSAMDNQFKVRWQRRNILGGRSAPQCACRLCAALGDHRQFSEAKEMLTRPVPESYVDVDGGRADLLKCVRCLAGLLEDFDLCDDALEYHAIAVAAMEVHPGPEHPDTILSRKQFKDLTRFMYASNSRQLSAKVRTNPNVAVPRVHSRKESRLGTSSKDLEALLSDTEMGKESTLSRKLLSLYQLGWRKLVRE